MSNSAEEQLQKALVETYFANLEFLKQNDKDLYSRIMGLSEVLESGLYPERYHLEFIKEKGEFDILDSTTNKYVYSKKAKQFNHKIVNSVKFDKSSNFSMLISETYDLKNPYVDIDLDYESYEEIEGIINNDVKAFTDILKDDTTGKKNFKYINKFIFIGTLLGRHIPDIQKKVGSQHYFIYEYNLEIFRLSLFVTSYDVLAQNSTVSFSIMDDENIFMTKFQLFLEKNMYENYNLKFATTNYNVSNAMHTMISTLYKVNPAIFDYTRVLHNLVKLSTKRVNSEKILVPHKKENTFTLSSKKPVLFVAAGPSLGENIEWLKQNQERFVIVTIGSSYRKLMEHEIVPDILSTVEPSYRDLIAYQFNDEDIKSLQKTIILASILSPENFCNRFSDEQLFFYEVNHSLKKNETVYRGYSVGEITVSLLLDLGVDELYLLGTDLAVNQDTGATHYGYKEEIAKQHDLEDYDITQTLSSEKSSFKDELIPVKGNFQKEVFTTRIFINSIFAYAQSLAMFKKQYQKVFNLSNYGAFLEGTQAKRVEDIDCRSFNPINKDDLKDELLEKLNTISEHQLTQSEQETIQTEIQYFTAVYDEISTLQSQELKSFMELYDVMTFVENSIRKIGYPTFLDFQMIAYFKFTNMYLCYYFNEKKIKNEIKKVNQVKSIWLEQVLRLVGEYLEYFRKI